MNIHEYQARALLGVFGPPISTAAMESAGITVSPSPAWRGKTLAEKLKA